MPQLTAEIASKVVGRHPLGNPVLKEDGTSHRVRGYRFLINGRHPRHLVIALPDRRDGPTVYINRRSAELEEFPVTDSDTYFPGVSVSGQYMKGHTGVTGDAGISTAAASCPTLHPSTNDVLRLSCTDTEDFNKLLRWYSGEVTLSEVARGPQLPSEDAETVDEEAELGVMSDPEMRRTVERFAVDMAKIHYANLNFEVQERGKPFDLNCTPLPGCAAGTPTVHVEVKGSVGSARAVQLTRNEIADARNSQGWRSDLFIVSDITLAPKAGGGWTASGGRARILTDWKPQDVDLEPIVFKYVVPR